MRAPTAAELKFVNQRTRALVRAQRPRLHHYWGYVPPPTNTAAPVISGAPPAVGTTFTSTTGTWTGAPTYARQWLRNGANIVLNGTQVTYTAVAADSGTNLSCRVTGTNVSGSATATSNVIAVT
jgi:hypothetical protein